MGMRMGGELCCVLFMYNTSNDWEISQQEEEEEEQQGC